MIRWLTSCLTLLLVMPVAASAETIVSTFEDLGLPANSFNNDAPSSFFTSAGNSFNNTFSPDFGGIWSGWSISSTTDTTTPGFTNQYSAITGSGADGSPTYAVAYTFGSSANPFNPSSSFVNLVPGTNPVSIELTNTTYAYLSMLNGDSFESAFGHGDFFLLTISGYNQQGGGGTKTGEVDFYLANFLGTNSYIVNTWTNVNLSSLAGSSSLVFGLQSSQNDPVFGMNTPAFFAADNFTVQTVPEPASWFLCLTGVGIVVMRRWKSNGARTSIDLGLREGEA
jgi:hypothetical protein